MLSKIDTSGKLVTVQVTKDDGEVLKKMMDFDTYLEFINSSAAQSSSMLSVGKMPRGFYDGAISPVVDDTFWAVLNISVGKIPVVYFDAQMILPFPTLCFKFKVTKGNVNESRVFALTEDEADVSDTSKLYHYPFTNVYGDGKICWGSNQLPKVRTFKELESLVQMFLSTPNNNDLFNSDKMLSNFSGTAAAFFRLLEGKETFPIENLKNTGNTVEELLG